MAFINPIAEQTVEVIFNNEVIDKLDKLEAQVYVEKNYNLNTKAGINTLTLRYTDWNGNKTTTSQADPRPMAIFLRQLQLYSGDSVAQPLSQLPTVQPDSTSIVPDIKTPPAIDLGEGNLVITESPDTLHLEGISDLENGDYRWGLGPETTVNFLSDKAQALEVEMSFFNPIEGQSLIVTFNGAVVQELSRLHQGTEMNLKFYVNTIPGNNHLTITYMDWNGNKTAFAPEDTRPMAVLFKLLEIRNRL